MKSGADTLSSDRPLLDVLEQMRRVNGDGEFVFHSLGPGPSLIRPVFHQQHFIRMG